MKLPEGKKSGGNIIIVGCGRLGANLANTLSDDEKSVVIIDQNKDSFRKLSS
ncbi:MAG: NAD-binding protein, partial [Clostridiales bacterium]|nr:NAD-binding protein [Clostridiales bacterium]